MSTFGILGCSVGANEACVSCFGGAPVMNSAYASSTVQVLNVVNAVPGQSMVRYGQILMGFVEFDQRLAVCGLAAGFCPADNEDGQFRRRTSFQAEREGHAAGFT